MTITVEEYALIIMTPYPFNDFRYDLVVSYILSKLNTTFDVYDMVKVHALVDALHVIETGRPVIGGEFQPWDHGPVAPPAYARANRILGECESLDMFHIVKMAGPRPLVGAKPNVHIDLDEFSQSEIDAMERAAQIFDDLDAFDKLYPFFHDPERFMGFAWTQARKEDRPLSWLEIIDAYEREYGTKQTIARLTIEAVS